MFMYLLHRRTRPGGFSKGSQAAPPGRLVAKAALILGMGALLALHLGGRILQASHSSTTEEEEQQQLRSILTITDDDPTYADLHTDPPQLPSSSTADITSSSDRIKSNSSSTMKRPPISPPLRASGRHILDAHNNRLKLASINWYGASDIHSIAGGLAHRHRTAIAATIRRLGFNSVRLPYSDEMVMTNPLIPSSHLAANPDLHGLRALDVYEAVVNALADAGVGVIVNNHNTQSAWFTGMTLCDATWRNDYLPAAFCRVRQTETQWIEHWETVMRRFADQPFVLGADLRNEVHGFWGTVSWDGWAGACERVGERLLGMQPDWLMFVEGVSSANDVSGARERPVKYSVPGRVVYSAHVYSWSGWGSMSPFGRRKYPSFREEMRRNWAYLLEEELAPVWVGEFGVGVSADERDRHYWDNLMRYLKEVDADFGYWALNPRKPHDNEYESYSILGDDWKSEIKDDFRLRDLRSLMSS